MNWIKQVTILKGQLVELIPLQEKHFSELEILAREKRIWEFIPIDMSTSEKCIHSFANAIIEKEKETQFPFVIFHKQEKKIIGGTRLMNIETPHKKLEIGWIRLHPDYWATAINLECKLLLLTFCFEELGTIRVQLKTSVENIRSRKAIEKIGGQFEGILRYDMIRDNGTKRNSAYYSIIEDEWENAKAHLVNQFLSKQAMKNLIYRTATNLDLKQLQHLCLLSYGQFQSEISVENWQKWEMNFKNDDTFLNLLSIATCFVCESENKIIGMAFLIPHGNPSFIFEEEWSYIRLVGIHPKYEGKGIGKKLTQECIDEAKKSGEKIIALHTSEFQHVARHIYESLGFIKQKNLDLIYGKQYYLYTLQLN